MMENSVPKDINQSSQDEHIRDGPRRARGSGWDEAHMKVPPKLPETINFVSKPPSQMSVLSSRDLSRPMNLMDHERD